MNENTELLECIYKSAEMGVNTLTDLIKELNNKDNKIKYVIEDELKEYEKYLKESEKFLKKNNTYPKNNNALVKIMAKMGIKKEVILDNSDAAITKMLVQGLTMGVVEISAKIDNYKEIVDHKYLSLAKDFLKFQEKAIDNLKLYL
ncbi:MAG: hypothetical protein RR325_00920 [Bacilli bacterium]